MLGREVKSLRNKQGSLAGSRVLIRGGEAFLVGMTITPYQTKKRPGNCGAKNRKTSADQKEINYLAGKAEEKA